jgi:hypothetical protein
MTLWGLMFFWATQTPFRVSPTKHELDGIIKYPIVNKEPKSSKLLLMMQFLQTRPLPLKTKSSKIFYS